MNRLRVISTGSGGRAHDAPLVESRRRPRRRACRRASARCTSSARRSAPRCAAGGRCRASCVMQQRHAEDELALGQVLGRALMRRCARRVRWSRAVPLIRSTSPSRNTRSHGTSTSSKKTTQSISSKREPSGWSKCERPRSKLSRHRNFRPGRAAGDGEIERERAVRLAVAGQARRIDRDLVGQRPQRRQHARAAHDDAGVGLAHHVQRGALLQVEHARDGCGCAAG